MAAVCLAELGVPALKELATELGIKTGGVGWPTCCPPSGIKADIVAAIRKRRGNGVPTAPTPAPTPAPAPAPKVESSACPSFPLFVCLFGKLAAGLAARRCFRRCFCVAGLPGMLTANNACDRRVPSARADAGGNREWPPHHGARPQQGCTQGKTSIALP